MTSTTVLEFNDVQAGVLRPRPSPYVGTYLLFTVSSPQDGRALLARTLPMIRSAAEPGGQDGALTVSVALTFQGLKALGVPAASLDSFAPEFVQGMAARAAELYDVGASAPLQWEKPFGSAEIHVGVLAVAAERGGLDEVLTQALAAQSRLGVSLVFRQDCHMLPTKKEAFGFADGLSQPAIDGSGVPGTNTREKPIMPGEFLLGYPDETGDLPPMPSPEVLGRNGSYVVVRKVYQDVAAFRRYLRENSTDLAGEEHLGAKMMGRWPSGAPLALAPDREDAALGADPDRNDDFLYDADGDARGFRTPPGSHIRRMNPRDGLDFGDVRRHRLLRRSTSYGPPLPEGALDDDGADRGTVFVFICADIERQFEFVQSQWMNTSTFIGGSGTERDPIGGAGQDGGGEFTIPRQPIRRRLRGLPEFVVTRGGEYFYMPGLRALQWLADLDT
jgi:Dyp-type peroxidase family